jgi:hypothetical protein
VKRIGELGTTLAATSNRRTLQRATRRNIPKDAILHSHRRENLRSFFDVVSTRCGRLLVGPTVTQGRAGYPRWWPGFEPRSSHEGSMVDRAALRQVSSEFFGFPCHSFIPLIAPQSSPSIMQGWYNRPIYDRSNSGLGSTPVP